MTTEFKSALQTKNLMNKNGFGVARLHKGRVANYTGRGYRITELADGWLSVAYGFAYYNDGYADKERNAVIRAEMLEKARVFLIVQGYEADADGNYRKRR
jgi:hypothetical protein